MSTVGQIHSPDRVWVYAVRPGRTAVTTSPQGGRVVGSSSIVPVLHGALTDFRQSGPIVVHLRIDGKTRTSEVRDSLLAAAFATDADADAAVFLMAGRLSGAMDLRSKAHLLLVLATTSGVRARVGTWAFP